MAKSRSKKANTMQAEPLDIVPAPPMVPITEHQPELESDSTSDSGSSSSSSLSSRAGSPIAPDDNMMDTSDEGQNNKEKDVPKPLSPPPTVGKRKRGRPSKLLKPVVTGTFRNSFHRFSSTENHIFP